MFPWDKKNKDKDKDKDKPKSQSSGHRHHHNTRSSKDSKKASSSSSSSSKPKPKPDLTVDTSRASASPDAPPSQAGASSSHHSHHHGESSKSKSKSKGKQKATTSPPPSPPTPPVDGIRGLRIEKCFIDQNSGDSIIEPVSRRSLDFSCVAGLLELSIQLLESPWGQAQLGRLSYDTFESWDNDVERMAWHIGAKDKDGLRSDAWKFCQALRRRFARININKARDDFARRELHAVTRRIVGDPPADHVGDWDAREGFNMTLNGFLLDDMLKNEKVDTEKGEPPMRGNPAKKMKRSDWKEEVSNRRVEHQFAWMITFVHEFAHVYNSFISGGRDVHTPTEMNCAVAKAQGAGGEAGYLFEEMLWGGTPEIIINPSRDHGVAGDIYNLFPDRTAAKFPLDFMKQIVNNPRGYKGPPKLWTQAVPLKPEEFERMQTDHFAKMHERYGFRQDTQMGDGPVPLNEWAQPAEYDVTGKELHKAMRKRGVIIEAHKHKG